jgi:hypothetical protein
MKSWWPGHKSVEWSPGLLDGLLKSIIDERSKNLCFGNFVEKFSPGSSAQFAIWTNLHGSYHSLVRGLRELKQEEVIDSNLHIIKPNYFFIFNGNAIDFSPYSMETLTVITLLMNRNKDRVFYLKGSHESKRLWSRNGLKQELQGKIKKTKHFVSLERRLNKFFSTLPIALYLRKKSGVLTRFVQISNGNLLNQWGAEPLFKEFLYAPDYGKKQILRLKKRNFGDTNTLPVDLYIDAENGTHSLKDFMGLKKDDGDSVWRSFSGQTRTHRPTREFFYDSFSVFSLNNLFSRSTFSLYSRDTRRHSSRSENEFIKMTYLAFPKGELVSVR